MMLPNLMEACRKRDALLANLDLMEIALRLEEYRRETGSLPDALDALGDVNTVDPFSGEPCRYRPEKGVIYSVGGNRADDGGTPPTDSSKAVPALHEGDIVWRLPTAPR